MNTQLSFLDYATEVAHVLTTNNPSGYTFDAYLFFVGSIDHHITTECMEQGKTPAECAAVVSSKMIAA